jgi:hypothetical protein
MPALPAAFAVMLRPHGAAGYEAAGRCGLTAMPVRGASLALTTFDGRAIAGTVDEVFIPPGCDEHCTGTLFISARA